MGNRAKPLAFAPLSGDETLIEGCGAVMGWSVAEATGAAAAAASLMDGGQLLAVIKVPAGGAAGMGLADAGVEYTESVQVQVTDGQLMGVVYVQPA